MKPWHLLCRTAAAAAFVPALLIAPVIGLPAAQAQNPAEAEAQQKLADALLRIVTDLPANTPSRVFEARFAQAVDSQSKNCELVLAAIATARAQVANPAAGTALRNLADVLRGCAQGTGAVNGTNTSFALAPIPAFSVGGGTEYRR